MALCEEWGCSPEETEFADIVVLKWLYLSVTGRICYRSRKTLPKITFGFLGELRVKLLPGSR